MDEPDLLRRLQASAPAGPGGDLRGRVLAAAASELDRPTLAIDRMLARPLPWIAAALLLAALGVGIFLQEAASARRRAERWAQRRGPGPALDQPVERSVQQLAGMDAHPASARPHAPPTPVFGPWGVRRWLESPEGRDFR